MILRDLWVYQRSSKSYFILKIFHNRSQKNELNYAFDSNCLPQKHSSEIEQRLLALRVVIKRKILEQKMIQRAEIKTCFVLWVEFTQRITDKDIKLKRLIKIVQNNSVLRDAFKIIQTGLLKMPEFLFSSDGVNEILDSSNSYNIKECNKMEKVYSNHKYWVEKRGYFHQLRTNVKKRRFGTLLLQLKVFTGWKQFWIRSRSIQNQEFFQVWLIYNNVS